jgi:hypothetical protein
MEGLGKAMETFFPRSAILLVTHMIRFIINLMMPRRAETVGFLRTCAVRSPQLGAGIAKPWEV